MKAAVIHREGDAKTLRYEDVPTPDVPAKHCLVRVEVAGVCGSDLSGYLDGPGTARREGLIMSHEIAGVVVQVADDVTEVSPGDRVTVDPQVTCGECDECRQGLISICANKRVLGSSLRGFVHGGMAEFVVVAANRLHTLPEDVTAAAGALVEPLSNALHVVDRHHFRIGDTVVILGCGTLGLLLVQCVKLAGAGAVIATDTNLARLELAKKLGADVTIDVTADSLEDAVDGLTDGRGADVAIEAVGITSTYQQAIHVVRRRGAVMFFGAATKSAEIPLYPILHKELTLIGCTGGNDRDTANAIRLIREQRVDVLSLVSRTFPLSEAAEALAHTARPETNSIKTQVVP